MFLLLRDHTCDALSCQRVTVHISRRREQMVSLNSVCKVYFWRDVLLLGKLVSCFFREVVRRYEIYISVARREGQFRKKT
jgi:hypothetical protein